MANISLKEIAQVMKEIDFCMMTTVDGNGTLHSRPMSNNKQVQYDGESYFFSYKDTTKVRDINHSPRTSLSYQGQDGWFIHVYGEAHLIEQKSRMEEHWSEDLNAWFPDGLETDGLVMIKVKAKDIRYWHEEKEGNVSGV